jgi:hypothetical protein
MGTIISALGQGKPILVMPRRARLGEQRNDHQFATVQRLCTRPGIAQSGVLTAFEADEVAERIDVLLALAEPGGGAPIARFAERRLTDAIRAAILGRAGLG